MCFVMLASCGVAFAADFQASFVVTTVNHQAGVEAPVATHRIVFDEGVVYDFDELDDNSITVFDTKRNRIVLLNRELKSRAIVSMDQLTKFAAEMRASATTPERKEKFGISAEVQLDPGDKYRIAYGGIQYTSTSQPAKTESVAKQFGQFADWACRLNMKRRLGIPPFVRMSLNAALASRNQLPLELAVSFKQQNEMLRLSSLHTVSPQLSKRDHQRIDEVSGMIALFKEIQLKELP
jgi:hypothetical protein